MCGMFNKDVLFGGERLDETVKVGEKNKPDTAEQVILLDALILSQAVPTDLGLARKTILTISKMKDGLPDGPLLKVGTLASAIAAKVDEGESGDLPAIVCFFLTESSFGDQNDAFVMQFVRRYDGPDIKDLAPLVDDFTGEVSQLTATFGKPAAKLKEKIAS